jgi:hypothetical protein
VIEVPGIVIGDVELDVLLDVDELPSPVMKDGSWGNVQEDVLELELVLLLDPPKAELMKVDIAPNGPGNDEV